MAFNDYELATQSGQPVELYTFRYGTNRLDYTSSDSAYVYETRAYEPASLQRTAIEETSEISRSDLKITCAHDFEPSRWFDPYPPSEVVTLELRRLHRPDGDVKLFWIGRVLTCRWVDTSAELSCESLVASMRRPGLRRLYQRGCPHVLYGTGCGVAAASYRHSATLSAVSGTTVTASAFDAQPDGYFAGGYLEWQNGTRLERRAIRTHVGTDCVMSHPIPGLPPFATVYAYAGCDHTLATCGTKFANQLRYGGFPYVPQKNPFGQASVFY